MRVYVRYNTTMHDINLPVDATVRHLQTEVQKTLQIAPLNQKLIFRGKPLQVKEEPLSAFKIADGAKIMLVASENPHTVINPAPPPRLQPLEVLPEYACRIDDSIVALGAPTGAIAGWKGTNTATLPEAPLIVRTINGVAEFSLETDALFLKYPGGFNDRIFLSDLTAVGSVPIQDGTYSVIAMQTKLEKIFWIAFVPAQYTEAILTTLDPYTGLKRQLLFAL